MVSIFQTNKLKQKSHLCSCTLTKHKKTHSCQEKYFLGWYMATETAIITIVNTFSAWSFSMHRAQTTVFPDISIDTSTVDIDTSASLLLAGAGKRESRIGRVCAITFFPQNISCSSELSSFLISSVMLRSRRLAAVRILEFLRKLVAVLWYCVKFTVRY